jgi:cell division protein FtsN
MASRYLIFIAVLVFHGPISYGQFDSPLNPRQVSINPDLIIQVGAFRQETNSLVLKEKLSAILDKPVILVAEDGFFKVRITGFSSQEEMEKFYPTLAFIGLKNFWVLPVKKHEEIRPQAVIQPDTTRQLISEDTVFPVVSEEISVASQPVITLQVGVFHDKSEALNAQKMITTKLNLRVEIVQEWEYYKVFVTGFHTIDEANKYYSALAKLGYPKISLIENYKKK